MPTPSQLRPVTAFDGSCDGEAKFDLLGERDERRRMGSAARSLADDLRSYRCLQVIGQRLGAGERGCAREDAYGAVEVARARR